MDWLVEVIIYESYNCTVTHTVTIYYTVHFTQTIFFHHYSQECFLITYQVLLYTMNSLFHHFNVGKPNGSRWALLTDGSNFTWASFIKIPWNMLTVVLKKIKLEDCVWQIQWNKLTCLKTFHPPCHGISSVLRWNLQINN